MRSPALKTPRKQAKALGRMTATPPFDLATGITAALDWWRMAGVEWDFLDNPQDWRPKETPQDAAPPPAFPTAQKVEPEAPVALRLGGEAEGWPQDLAGFQRWWMEEPSLDSGPLTSRVPPRGASGARLMVIVPQPETGDAESGRLLSGAQGRLLAAMLPALGLAEQDLYLAAALPRVMPAADWAGLRDAGLGAVLAHHIALVAPHRILAFGGNILPLLGHDMPQSPANLLQINQQGASVPATIPALAAHDLALLLDRARSKAGFWQNWLRWMTDHPAGAMSETRANGV